MTPIGLSGTMRASIPGGADARPIPAGEAKS